MGPEKDGNQRVCAQDPELLAALAGGELTGAEEAECRRHLSGCPTCRAHLARLEAALAALRQMPEPVPPAQGVDRVLLEVQSLPVPGRPWWLVRSPALSMGAAAGALVGLVIIVALWPQGAPVPGVGAPASDQRAGGVQALAPPGEKGMRGAPADVVAGRPAAPPAEPAGARVAGGTEKEAEAGDSQDRGLPSVRPGSRARGATGPGPAREAAPSRFAPEHVRTAEARRPASSRSAAETLVSGADLAAAQAKSQPHVPAEPQPAARRAGEPERATHALGLVDAATPREAPGGLGVMHEGMTGTPGMPGAAGGAPGGVAPGGAAGPVAEGVAGASRGPGGLAGPVGAPAPAPRARALATPVAPGQYVGQAAWTVADEFWQIRVDVPTALVERTPASLGLTIRGRAALTGVRAQVVDERGKELGDVVEIAAVVPDRPVDASVPVTPAKAGEQVMGVVVEAEDPTWRTDVAIKVRVEGRQEEPPERPVALVLREVPLREAAMKIAVQARIEAEVPDNLADLVVDADFSEPIPARAALQALADQVGATLVETDRGFTFARSEGDGAD